MLPVNYAGVALIVLAIVFFIAEIKITSYGLLTVAGIVSLVLGSLMLFKTTEPALRVSVELIACSRHSPFWWSGSSRGSPCGPSADRCARASRGWSTRWGRRRSPLNPRGKVFVHGEIWDAVADEPVAAGEPVEVVAVRNLTLAVRRRDSFV